MGVDWPSRLRARIGSFEASGSGDVLSAEATAEIEQVALTGAGAAGTMGLLAAAHWYRYLAGDDLGELRQALALSQRLHEAQADELRPEMLGTALDTVDAVVAGDEDEQRPAGEAALTWARLYFSIAGLWLEDEDEDADPDVLARALAAAVISASLVPEDHPLLAGSLGVLGLAMSRDGAATGNSAEIRSAVAVLDEALDLVPTGDERRVQLLGVRIGALVELARQAPTPQARTDLAVALVESISELGPDHPGAHRMVRLGNSLAAEFDAVDPQSHPDLAVALARLMVVTRPAGDRARIAGLYCLGSALHLRAGSQQSPDDNREALSVARDLVAEIDDTEHDLRGTAMLLLATCLQQRYELAGDSAAVKESIAVARSALAPPADDPVIRAECEVVLGFSLLVDHQAGGHRSVLDEAIAVLEAVPGPEESVPVQPRQLSLLGAAYTYRFRLDGGDADLDRAVDLGRAAVAATPAGRPDRPDWLGNLGQALWLRFLQHGDRQDLELALDASHAAVAATPAAYADRARHCMNLGSVLQHRFRTGGDPADLDRAIDAFSEADARVSPDTHAATLARSSLSTALGDRFELRGDTRDLDDSLALMRAAVSSLDEDSIDYPGVLNNLASVLHRRFTQNSAAAELDESIEASRRALRSATPAGRDATQARLHLGNSLRTRFEVLDHRTDIDEAVAVLSTAGRTANSADRPSALINLSIALSSRFAVSAEQSDLDDAVTAVRTAVAALPPGDVRTARYQATLGMTLNLRAANGGAADDLDQAVTALRSAEQATRPGEPERAARMLSLSQALLNRSRNSGSLADLAASLDLARSAAHAVVSPVSVRIEAARLWASLAAGSGTPADGLPGWRLAIELLPLIAWQGVPRSDQERALSALSGLPSIAAAAALGADQPELAVELLEQGRALLWAQLLDTRTDLTELSLADPALAVRLAELRAALDQHRGNDLHTGAEPLRTDRTHLAREWDRALEQARALPGFADFLRPPPFASLARAATEGPVVLLNVSEDRCDALIITSGGVRVVPLPGLTDQGLVTQLNALYAPSVLAPRRPAEVIVAPRVIAGVLGWTWENIVAPVLREIGTTERIWWCPTGYLATLPLHAATDPQTGRCTMDSVVSSYTPTLRALLNARAAPQLPDGDADVLIVAVPDVVGAPKLIVQPEIDAITERLGDRCRILSGPDATHSRVCAELGPSRWVHFACHGVQDPADPSAGSLLLYDRPLSVLDVTGLHLSNAELAFLSACQTANSGATLADESIHLASALQTAGFRQVVATLWPLYDAPAPIVTRSVYAGLARSGDASGTARLLHDAVLLLRDDGLPPAIWAPYLHIGP
ncbi:CHAT domain-containing protein [Streptacidiphilus sp. N1-10]|uniref:CHAT domain-containing protein n=1 Tax=Streptacidiphilus jeojiensis TaxID=3229225 RepID=A0ABV6XFH9_9ACTN